MRKYQLPAVVFFFTYRAGPPASSSISIFNKLSRSWQKHLAHCDVLRITHYYLLHGPHSVFDPKKTPWLAQPHCGLNVSQATPPSWCWDEASGKETPVKAATPGTPSFSSPYQSSRTARLVSSSCTRSHRRWASCACHLAITLNKSHVIYKSQEETFHSKVLCNFY